jgi:hypothetical protein
MTIFHQNKGGLQHKIEELICLLTSNLNPHIICLPEHYSIEQNLLIFNPENYQLAFNFSHKNHYGGGVCIYIRYNLEIIHSMFLNFVLRKPLKLAQLKVLMAITLL